VKDMLIEWLKTRATIKKSWNIVLLLTF